MPRAVVGQSSDEKLDWSFNWLTELQQAVEDVSPTIPAETISTSDWSITPTGPTLSGANVQSPLTTVFVNGIVSGTLYTLRNVVTTNQGRIISETLLIRGKD
jgi:hypothetical protein